MAVDPEISLGIKPVTSPFSGNPLETLGQIQGIQAQQNQLKQFAATFAARQKAGQIIASAPDLASGLDAASKDPDVMGFAGDVYNVAREAQLAQTRVAGETQEQGLKGYHVFTSALPSTLTNPESFGPNAATALSLTSPQARGAVNDAIRNLHSAITSGGPDPQQDPQGYADFVKKNIVSTALGSGTPAAQLHAITGENDTQNQGGALVSGVKAPPQGAPALFGGAPGGSFTPSSKLSLGLSPQIVSLTDKGGTTTPTLVGGQYGTPGAAPTGGGLGAGLDTADGPQISLPGGNPLMPGTAGQLPPIPASLQRQLGTPAGGNPLGGAQPAAGGGVPLSSGGPSLVQQTYGASRGKDMADYQGSLDSAVGEGNRLLQNLSEARDAFGQIKTGGGADTYSKLASFAQSFGASQSLVDKIGNGNKAASDEFQKLMVNTTNSQIKQQLAGAAGGHLGQQEFETFQKNNPNLETDPRAIDKIFNFWTKIYQRNSAEQSQMQQFVKQGGDITDWPSEWQKRSTAQGFINPAKTDSSQGTSPAVTHRYVPGQGIVPVGAQ